MTKASVQGVKDLVSLLGVPDRKGELEQALALAPSPGNAVAALHRLAQSGGGDALASWPRARLSDLVAVLGSSQAAVRQLVAMGPDWVETASSYARAGPGREKLAQEARELDGEGPAELAAGLRRLAGRETYRLGARDLLGLAPLEETLGGLSDLAEACLEAAVTRLRVWQADEDGDALDGGGTPLGFCVLGLGKLGGRELNYSSDVDLMYLYESEGAADPARARSFFSRLAADVTRVIGEVTAEGVVFRVDLNLRPEGVSGPLVNSVANALSYYEGWGETWERAALIKTRPVAGDVGVGRRFVKEVRPFIFRRHLDYQTVDDLRRMKQMIDARQQVQAPGSRNVKLGRGGIREIEFVVQLLQLIHGGHEPSVACRPTMEALGALEAGGFIQSSEARRLSEAYRFLRDTEHALQVAERGQVHTLPAGAEELRVLARRLGYGCGRRGRQAGGDEIEAFEAEWEEHTGAVQAAFVRFHELRPEGDQAGAGNDSAALALLGLIESGRGAEAAEILSAMGFADPGRAAGELARIYLGNFGRPVSPQRRRAVEVLAPELLQAAASSADPERALRGVVDFLVRTGAHTSYLALLGGSPATMRILVDLFASSPYLASLLVGRPELLDSLLRSDLGAGAERAGLKRVLQAEIGSAEDEETAMALLRRFRSSQLLRVGMADLAGALDGNAVHRQLSSLAEVCLCAALETSRRLLEQGGVGGPWKTLELAVMALGKLGSREMTYGSDLDLIFVYRSPQKGFDAAAHALATRWAQRVIALLQTRTADGAVYAIDMRLRPSGGSGPLVTSLERFISYHSGEAALWERQAHIRARVVWGSKSLAESIEASRSRFVFSEGLDQAGVSEIAGLRERMEHELAGEGPTKRNVKSGRGGLADIEFLVQMLQLRHGRDHPEARVRSTAEAIDGLRAVGALDDDQARALRDGHDFLCRLQSRMRLERDRPVESISTDAASLDPLARRMGVKDGSPGKTLLGRYRRICEEMRRLYEHFFFAG